MLLTLFVLSLLANIVLCFAVIAAEQRTLALRRDAAGSERELQIALKRQNALTRRILEDAAGSERELQIALKRQNALTRRILETERRLAVTRRLYVLSGDKPRRIPMFFPN
ncbi:MAG: hypothetical protein QM346_12305 [Chloroflexota bacterium]|nr:hypothetical protein [Chloroflexota bacterium]